MILDTSAGTFHITFRHNRPTLNPKALKGLTPEQKAEKIAENAARCTLSCNEFTKKFRTKRRVVGTTECFISTVAEARLRDIPADRIAKGMTGLSEKDHFNRFAGQKNSFARALDAAAAINRLFTLDSVREECWNSFLSQVRGAKSWGLVA